MSIIAFLQYKICLQVGIEPCFPITRGLPAMYDLYATDNETLVFTVDIPANTQYVRYDFNDVKEYTLV